jgi:hypothetical protein
VVVLGCAAGGAGWGAGTTVAPGTGCAPGAGCVAPGGRIAGIDGCFSPGSSVILPLCKDFSSSRISLYFDALVASVAS